MTPSEPGKAIRTFDSREFGLSQPGIYTLYRHRALPVEVQAHFRPCSLGALCTCAVGVRVDDVITILDVCTKGHLQVGSMVDTFTSGFNHSIYVFNHLAPQTWSWTQSGRVPNEEDRLPEGFEVISIDEGREYKVQKICISQCWEYSRKAAVLFIFNSLTEGRPSVWRLSETGVDADVRSNLRVIRRQGQHRGTLRHPQRESQGRHPDPQRGATNVRKGRRGELQQCFCKRLEVRKV